MPNVKRAAYLVYYLKEMNWPLLRRFMAHVQVIKGYSRGLQWSMVLRDSLRYNISPLEWYQFGFMNLSEGQKSSWAGTGTMYEFQLRANPPGARAVLDDKRAFYKAYQRFFRHRMFDRETLAAHPELLSELLSRHHRLVLKAARGKCGRSVRFISTPGWRSSELLSVMQADGYDLLETSIEQHPDLNRLSPSGVNTVRIVTALDSKDQAYLLGSRLRISVDSRVDNLAAGNLAAPVDDKTGRVTGPGVYSDITRAPQTVHPITRTPIEGFRIPHWSACLEMALEAQKLFSRNRSIGWDIAVTGEGPGLIEGNHDWCKLVWQLPVRQGLKGVLDAVPLQD